MNKILFKPLNNAKNLYKLKKATSGSAGFDLVAAINNTIFLTPGSSILVPCGFSLEIPKNFEAQVRPRSGLALKNSITVLNSPGTIDSDYRGEIGVILVNLSADEFIIEDGERIAQMVISKHERACWSEVKKLNSTKRGPGGFGSTGIK